MLTHAQIQWAKTHDWFDRYENGKLYVWNRFTFKNRFGRMATAEECIPFNGSFFDLRAWAGY